MLNSLAFSLRYNHNLMFADLQFCFRGFSKFYENQKIVDTTLCNWSIHKPSLRELGSLDLRSEVQHKILARFGSDVLTFIRYYTDKFKKIRSYLREMEVPQISRNCT